MWFVMGVEEKLVRDLEKFLRGEYREMGNNLCYFAMDLFIEEYDPQKLADVARARDDDLAQRLGYLAEVCAMTAEMMHLDGEREKLGELYRGLAGDYGRWLHLETHGVEWGKRIDILEHNQTLTNRKWKIYSPLRSDEIEDFVDLYVTRDWKKFTPGERTEMRGRGIKYTRFQRK
jgi:hypothetical protein